MNVILLFAVIAIAGTLVTRQTKSKTSSMLIAFSMLLFFSVNVQAQMMISDMGSTEASEGYIIPMRSVYKLTMVFLVFLLGNV